MIEFRNTEKVYPNGAKALIDINFKIESGEFVFCIGESGAGKSTLIKLITCEERPSKGTVILDNYELSRLQKRLIPNLRRKIGMIFQDFRLIDSKTVFENVAFAMEIMGASKAQIKRRVSMVLSVVGLRDKADHYPSELSGGEAQRVGIARAMINNPGLILADEPTGNLDPVNGEAILALLEEINRAGTTVICCTHDASLVDLMQKRVIELSNGRLVRDEQRGAYTDCIAEKELSFERSDEDITKMDEAIYENIHYEHQQRQAKRAKQSAEIKSMLDEDSRKRRNRLSLAERIAKMRMLAENIEPNNPESTASIVDLEQ
ncbi:MAG TPA: cell division ATP-binding protein FtsE [Clostridiaceae bacterium]|nr:cell division ATP-binding protein FtsE [Clostridiaceae bacterium]